MPLLHDFQNSFINGEAIKQMDNRFWLRAI